MSVVAIVVLVVVALLAGFATYDVIVFVHRARDTRVELEKAKRLLWIAQQDSRSVRALLESALEDGRQQVRVPLERELEARRNECLTLYALLEQRSKRVKELEEALARIQALPESGCCLGTVNLG